MNFDQYHTTATAVTSANGIRGIFQPRNDLDSRMANAARGLVNDPDTTLIALRILRDMPLRDYLHLEDVALRFFNAYGVGSADEPYRYACDRFWAIRASNMACTNPRRYGLILEQFPKPASGAHSLYLWKQGDDCPLSMRRTPQQQLCDALADPSPALLCHITLADYLIAARALTGRPCTQTLRDVLERRRIDLHSSVAKLFYGTKPEQEDQRILIEEILVRPFLSKYIDSAHNRKGDAK